MREKEEKNHHKLANKSAQSKSGCFFSIYLGYLYSQFQFSPVQSEPCTAQCAVKQWGLQLWLLSTERATPRAASWRTPVEVMNGGINISRSTHFHLTLTSLSASVSLPCKPSENIGGSLYWLRRLGFSPRRLKCHRLPDVSLKSPVPPLAVAPGYYYPPLKEWQSGPKRRDTNLCGWSCSAASSQCSRPIR